MIQHLEVSDTNNEDFCEVCHEKMTTGIFYLDERSMEVCENCYESAKEACQEDDDLRRKIAYLEGDE